jgi:hypothetical protein
MCLNLEALVRMLHLAMITHPGEIGCDECFEQLDSCAELALVGRPLAQARPLVHGHLELCLDCREEFEALLRALQTVAYDYQI